MARGTPSAGLKLTPPPRLLVVSWRLVINEEQGRVSMWIPIYKSKYFKVIKQANSCIIWFIILMNKYASLTIWKPGWNFNSWGVLSQSRVGAGKASTGTTLSLLPFSPQLVLHSTLWRVLTGRCKLSAASETASFGLPSSLKLAQTCNVPPRRRKTLGGSYMGTRGGSAGSYDQEVGFKWAQCRHSPLATDSPHPSGSSAIRGQPELPQDLLCLLQSRATCGFVVFGREKLFYFIKERLISYFQ